MTTQHPPAPGAPAPIASPNTCDFIVPGLNKYEPCGLTATHRVVANDGSGYRYPVGTPICHIHAEVLSPAYHTLEPISEAVQS